MGTLKYITDKLFSNNKEVALVEYNGGITSGSDSNGSWTKFPDGTMICTGDVDEQNADAQLGTSSLYRNSTPKTTTFAMSFFNVPKVTVSANTPVNSYGWIEAVTSSTDSFVSGIISGAQYSDLSGSYIAIGRWK